MSIQDIYQKCRNGERLNKEEGLQLYREASLSELSDLATQARYRKNPDPVVTWVADTNLNYTNVCDAYCTFCAFYRAPNSKAEDKYTYTVKEMIEKIKQSRDRFGVTTVLIQGGLNPDIPFEYYTDFVKACRSEVPDVHPHLYTASEIKKMAEITGKDNRWVLEQLKEAGLDTIPGGGAEILTDRVRLKLSKTKVDSAEWLSIHQTAHELGYRTTATMMYGHLEEDVDIIEHFDGIRQVQDVHGGFTAFIPWSFKPDNTPLGKQIKRNGKAVPGPAEYLRILAVSRLYLDNFDHIQASWFSEGKKTGQMGLYYGADDFGGTIFEETVLLSANFEHKTTTDRLKTLIREAGFTPAQRDTKYNILSSDTGPAPEEVRPLSPA